jgi:hypothetical protein
MRQPILRAVSAAAIAMLGACAEEAAAPVAGRPPAAVSVQRYARPAVETTDGGTTGYSADARRLADCLASYPNYDYRTDRFELRPGVTRPCPL